MKSILFIISIYVFCSASIFGQTDYKQRADRYYKYYNYQRALKDYLRLYRKDKENTELLSLVINCILKDNTQRETAIPYIETLLELEPNNIEANYNYALALFHAHEFDKAEEVLHKNKSILESNTDYKSKRTHLINSIQNAKALVQRPVNIKFINLGDDINSS